MPKKGKKTGKRAASPLPQQNTTTAYSPGLHKLESQSRKLLQKVSEKRKAKWKPVSKPTTDLLMDLIEKHKLLTYEGLRPADIKVMDEHVASLKERLEDAFQETLAPPSTMDYNSLNSDIHHHTKVLQENKTTLKKLQQNISKIKEIIADKERELEVLELTAE